MVITNVPVNRINEKHTSLVGGIPTPLKYMKVSCDDYSKHIYIYVYICTHMCMYIYIYTCIYYGKIQHVPNHQPDHDHQNQELMKSSPTSDIQ